MGTYRISFTLRKAAIQVPACETAEDLNILHLGFDNTDSIQGKCTTHMAFKITDYLLKENEIKFVDFPLLIRLNPNIPWKTRGNGAVCLRIATRGSEHIIDYVKNFISVNSDISNGANPGFVAYEGVTIPTSVRQFSRTALYNVLSLNDAEKIIENECIQCYKSGNGHGSIGALAAIGCLLEGDHTFEAISYRTEENVGTPRWLKEQLVLKMSAVTFPRTFNNIDAVHKRSLITPHGPDPVFCGIRGEDPITVLKSLLSLQTTEILEGYLVFRTNQGTNMHLQNQLVFSQVKPFMAGYVRGTVSKIPYVLQGGHVLFEISDIARDTYPVAVYEPTDLGRIAKQLVIGDIVDIGFGVREEQRDHSRILNLEYLAVLRLNSIVHTQNPLCKVCRKRMKSEGKGKGYQCKECKIKTIEKYNVTVKRDIVAGFYLSSNKSHRHLTKPLHRFGRENSYPYVPGIYPFPNPNLFHRKGHLNGRIECRSF